MGRVMKALLMTLAVAALLLTGCDKMTSPDFLPPVPPSGLYTETGDNFIELYWAPNRDGDIAGYNVFVSSSYNGRYELVGSTRSAYFFDEGARNGNTYYYAVTAFDYDGNESELSKDVAYDIPRPEGYDVVVTNFRQSPSTAGYDFSQYAICPSNDRYADMWFEYFDGQYYMDVSTDSDIQDLGPTNSILDVRTAPASGWSATHDVLLQVGHTYVVWTWDDHYAKFRVKTISQNRVVFDWAYQLQESNPMLRPSHRSGGERQLVQAATSRVTQ
jgi:hypothetical protein